MVYVDRVIVTDVGQSGVQHFILDYRRFWHRVDAQHKTPTNLIRLHIAPHNFINSVSPPEIDNFIHTSLLILSEHSLKTTKTPKQPQSQKITPKSKKCLLRSTQTRHC